MKNKKELNIDGEIIKINDVFCSSWGYEQTNVNFYQVVGIKGAKTVLLKEIDSCRSVDDSWQGTAKAVLNKFINERIYTKRVNLNSFNDYFVRISNFKNAYLMKDIESKQFISNYA